MRFRYCEYLIAAMLLLLVSACGGGAAQASASGGVSSVPVVTGNNVMTLTVDGSTCNGDNSTIDKPCVSVQICESSSSSSSSNCLTINDILLDTGSYGLRIYNNYTDSNGSTGNLLNSLNLVQETGGSGSSKMAQCEIFGGGTITWGGVFTASVILGGEDAVTVPVQVIDSTFGDSASSCLSSADAEFSSAFTVVTGPDDVNGAFNGILGVGNLLSECQDDCAQTSSNGRYFTCNNSSVCTGATASLSKQVQNPVSLLATDNNGLIIDLPSVPAGGAAAADGYLILGIGTSSNNSVSSASVSTFFADNNLSDDNVGLISTTFDGTDSVSVLDTGSNGFFFNYTTDTGLFPDCSGWYCPSSTVGLQAVNQVSYNVYNSSTSNAFFSVANFNDIINTGNNVFLNNGGGGSTGFVDLGLPFFLGHMIYVGYIPEPGGAPVTTTTSPLGTGPYYAY